MEHRIIKLLAIVLFSAFMLQSCYYDNYEELYPDPGDCDTTQVNYTNDVWPVINANCTSCHSATSPAGNIPLSNYQEIKVSVENGSLMGSIRHDQGYSPMPKGGGKLSDCSIKKMEVWIEQGALEN